MIRSFLFSLQNEFVQKVGLLFRACLNGGGGRQVVEVKYCESPHLSCKRDQIKMRDYMDKRVTPPKRVTSPTWGPPPPCKQALSLHKVILKTWNDRKCKENKNNKKALKRSKTATQILKWRPLIFHALSKKERNKQTKERNERNERKMYWYYSPYRQLLS